MRGPGLKGGIEEKHGQAGEAAQDQTWDFQAERRSQAPQRGPWTFPAAVPSLFLKAAGQRWGSCHAGEGQRHRMLDWGLREGHGPDPGLVSSCKPPGGRGRVLEGQRGCFWGAAGRVKMGRGTARARVFLGASESGAKRGEAAASSSGPGRPPQPGSRVSGWPPVSAILAGGRGGR